MPVLSYWISIIIGAVVGYMDYPWYLIFVGGLINTIGYLRYNMGAVEKIRKQRGEIGYFFYFITMIPVSSLLPAIGYFIAYFIFN